MQRTLSLVLDDKGLIKLDLYVGTSDEIDKYTTRFDNATNLRKKYQKQIDAFLQQHKDFLDSRDKNKKNFYGRIVVLEKNNDCYDEKKVLFKKHLIAFKNYIYKDKRTMQEFERLEKYGYETLNKKKLISYYLAREIRYEGTFAIKSRVEKIKRDINKDEDFYDILRIIIKAYKRQRESRPNLPSIEQIYSEYLQDKKVSVELSKATTDVLVESENTVGSMNEDERYIVDGVIYSKEEQELFDLDDLNMMDDTNFTPDGLGKNDKSIR